MLTARAPLLSQGASRVQTALPPHHASPGLHRQTSRVISSASAAAAPVAQAPAISLSEKALNHLKKLQTDGGDASTMLRVGVKQGGCSGLSYLMDFEKAANVKAEDHIINYEEGTFQLVVDPKSLLYLFGMRLDFSDALIGGGFQFHNPNATDSCGCGKSFGV